MKVPVIHLPLNYDSFSELVALRMKLAAAGVTPAEELAHFYTFRLWLCWAGGQAEWRPLVAPYGPGYDWTKDPITVVVEEFCRWKGGPGGLMTMLVSSGMVEVVIRSDLAGLVLLNFWQHNDHVDPKHKAMQVKGGEATAKVNRKKADDALAAQQLKVIQTVMPGVDLIGAGMSEDEQKNAVTVIMRIHRACGYPVPKSTQYTAPMLSAANLILKELPANAMQIFEEHYLRERSNPSLLREPERVILSFRELYDQIK